MIWAWPKRMWMEKTTFLPKLDKYFRICTVIHRESHYSKLLLIIYNYLEEKIISCKYKPKVFVQWGCKLRTELAQTGSSGDLLSWTLSPVPMLCSAVIPCGLVGRYQRFGGSHCLESLRSLASIIEYEHVTHCMAKWTTGFPSDNKTVTTRPT